MITLAFTTNEWAAFGMGMTAMLVLAIIAVALLLWHWGRTLPPEFREKPPGIHGEFFDSRRAEVRPQDAEQERRARTLTPHERDRMTFGRFENSQTNFFAFVPTDGRTPNPAWCGSNRKLIGYGEALAMLRAQYTNEDNSKQAQKLIDIAAGKFACVSVAGGMIERALKIGESSPSRPLPPRGRGDVSPLRNHPEFADDPSYIRQCVTDPLSAEDYTARTGRIPEVFDFRTAPGERGKLLTRKQAVEMAATHYGPEIASDVIASLARGASDFVGLAGSAGIRRYEPAS